MAAFMRDGGLKLRSAHPIAHHHRSDKLHPAREVSRGILRTFQVHLCGRALASTWITELHGYSVIFPRIAIRIGSCLHGLSSSVALQTRLASVLERLALRICAVAD